jgi:hypothetical protein
VVLLETIPQAVKPLGDGFVGSAGEGLGAGVDLDAGQNALGRKSFGERRATGTLLTDRFVIHDNAADELGGARGGKEHFPVGAPALLGRLNPERIETSCQGGDGLVGRENPFPFRNQRQRDALQIVARHADPPCVVVLRCLS